MYITVLADVQVQGMILFTTPSPLHSNVSLSLSVPRHNLQLLFIATNTSVGNGTHGLLLRMDRTPSTGTSSTTSRTNTCTGTIPNGSY